MNQAQENPARDCSQFEPFDNDRETIRANAIVGKGGIKSNAMTTCQSADLAAILKSTRQEARKIGNMETLMRSYFKVDELYQLEVKRVKYAYFGFKTFAKHETAVVDATDRFECAAGMLPQSFLPEDKAIQQLDGR